MTFERSHDKPRLGRTRLRELAAPKRAGSVPQFADRAPSRAEKRPFRRALTALYASLRAAEAGSVVAGGTSPEGAQLAREAMRVARSLLRELGNPRSPSVHAAALAYGLQHLVAQRLTLAAVVAGLETEQGRALAADAQRAQGRAERSWTAAVAAAGLLGGPRAPESDLAALIEAGRAPRRPPKGGEQP